ncbi:GNAT family N-acetyltransferase [Pseudomonas sp. LRP2-20]|nr:GNAT family N-acetyltransferase [Pseudomonas sp. LRP2-20]BDM22598.1 GNAT family N-acetyltransferase [Pseudomonas sp. LRP2-20]
MLSREGCVRPALRGDVPALIGLMRALAEFEGYLDEFAVDENALLARAFGESPECNVFVVQGAEGIAGYAVGLIIPFTYDLRPTVVLKELFVAPSDRGKGFGAALLSQVAAWSLEQGAGRLKWDVLAGNHSAEAFYRQHGGRPEAKWMPYQMSEVGLKVLSRME